MGDRGRGFRVKWDEGGAFNGTLSEDGQTLSAASGLQWMRKKP